MFSRTYCVYTSILSAAILFILSFSPALAFPSRECGGLHFEGEPDSPPHQILDIPSNGWLLVEAVASDGSPTWFDITRRDCASSSPLGVIDSGFEQGLLYIQPGSLKLRYGTVDPTLETPIRLSTYFVPEQKLQPISGESFTKERSGSGKPGNLYKDGEEGDDTETGDGEIVPNQGIHDTSWLGCLASAEPLNDFGLCAAKIEAGQKVSRQLGELRGSDLDHFTFDLEDSARVRIVYHGTVPAKGTLLLADGRSLMVGYDPSVTGLEIEADLVPGNYLLRFEGLGESAGTYELSLEVSEFGATL